MQTESTLLCKLLSSPLGDNGPHAPLQQFISVHLPAWTLEVALAAPAGLSYTAVQLSRQHHFEKAAHVAPCSS